MFNKKDRFNSFETTLDPRTGLELPVRYYVLEMSLSYFEVPLEDVQALVPTRVLHPIRKSNKTGVLCLLVSLCRHTTLGPYFSVALAIPVTHGHKPAPAMMPLLFEESWPNKGFYIYKEGVSTSQAFQAGSEIWGYPTFLAPIESVFKEPYQETTLVEEQRILTLRARRPEYVPTREEQQELCFYSVLDEEQLLETYWYVEGSMGRSRDPDSSLVIFGEHPLVSQFKAHKVGPQCFETRYYPSVRVCKPLPKRAISLRT